MSDLEQISIQLDAESLRQLKWLVEERELGRNRTAAIRRCIERVYLAERGEVLAGDSGIETYTEYQRRRAWQTKLSEVEDRIRQDERLLPYFSVILRDWADFSTWVERAHAMTNDELLMWAQRIVSASKDHPNWYVSKDILSVCS